MSNLVRHFLKDDSGATAIEYGVIGALISIAIIAGAGLAGTSINAAFSGVSDTIAAD